MRRARRRLPLLAALLSLLAGPVWATVFHSRDEALKLAFPDADRVEPKEFFLTAAQRAAIEERARAPLESDLLTVYVGYRGDRPDGYALFDTHLVRTLPETFLVVLTPDGAVASTHLLAFYEPLEYAPPERWLAQFPGATNGDELRVGRGIAGLTGSTLTAEAVTAGIRRALAVHAVLLKGH